MKRRGTRKGGNLDKGNRPSRNLAIRHPSHPGGILEITVGRLVTRERIDTPAFCGKGRTQQKINLKKKPSIREYHRRGKVRPHIKKSGEKGDQTKRKDKKEDFESSIEWPKRCHT